MYERFVQLLQQNDISAYQVAKATGIGQSTFTDWKNGRSIPKKDKLKKIARYFNVSISYFTGEEEAKYIEDDYEAFDYLYHCNEELLSPYLSKLIRLKRIESDYTERVVAANSDIDLDNYIKFETGEKHLSSKELYKIMLFLNTNVRYICGSISALLFTLNTLSQYQASDDTKADLRKVMLDRYDLYEIEKEFTTKNMD